jgi:hypothetical protein
MLRVPDDMNSYVMFETLNDRGLRTSQADLLKNYLFSQADERLPEAQQKWAGMVASVEALGIDDIVMTYLRHVTISLYGHTVERDVYYSRAALVWSARPTLPLANARRLQCHVRRLRQPAARWTGRKSRYGVSIGGVGT